MNSEAAVSAAFDELSLGDVFTFDELVGAVQSRRGRRLRIVELSELGDHDGLCAIWLRPMRRIWYSTRTANQLFIGSNSCCTSSRT